MISLTKAQSRLTALAVIAILLLVGIPNSAFGHCDSEDGPIISLIRESLENGEITPLLKWLAPEDEPEVKQLFEKVRSLRVQSSEAREIADRLFIETFVRLHRASEGAPFTGIKEAGSIPPIFAELDKSLESGKIDDLADKIAQTVQTNIVERFDQAAKLKEHQDDSVEDGRAFVEAYVTYMHFVEGLHNYLNESAHGHGSSQSDSHGH